MKTLKQVRPLMLAIGLLVHSLGRAQVTVPTNNSNAGDYVGCDNTSPFPLRIMQNDNQPIDWYTHALHRMRLYPTNNATLNSFNVPRNGFVGISPQPLFYNNPGPFSRLHLVDSVDNNPVTYAQDFGYRPWMRNGVTMTGNSDQMYVGHKYTYKDSTNYESGEINDRSDAVIEWSDNPDDAPWGTDRLRFMFTNDYSNHGTLPYGARSLEGMEAMRIYIPTDTTANVGVGDFFRAGVLNGQNEDPTERLHVRDGRVRIQQLPDDAPADSDYVVMVVDTTALPSGERGVVKWVPVSSLLSTADCEWSMTPGSGAGVNDVWTAVGGQVDGCPDMTEGVGIGVVNPVAKLDVFANDFATAAQVRTANTNGIPVALRVENNGAVATKQGIVLQSVGSTTSNLGMVGTVSGTGTTNSGIGMFVSGASTTNTGMGAIVNGATGSNIGLSANVSGSPAINVGTDVNVNGTPATTNIGERIRVLGVSPFNVGANVAVSDGTDDNIGVNVAATGTNGNRNYGVQINASGTTTRVRGVVATVRDATYTSYGAHLMDYSTGALYSHGVAGYSNGGTLQSFGVWGRSEGSANNNIGVFGFSGPGAAALPAGRHGLYAGVDVNVPGDLAAYIDGEAVITGAGVTVGGIWYPSDEQLKQNIVPYAQSEDESNLFDQLQVYGYEYVPNALPGAQLPEGAQVGFMAQQLAEFYPHLTRDVVYPARYDSLGQMVSPEVSYKAIRQEGLIPYMTLEIQRLRQQYNELAALVANCCANPDLPRSMAGSPQELGAVEAERLSIRPNPFPGVTQLQYHLPADGRVRLEVTSNDGRLVAVLADQRMSAGTHNQEWNATDLPAGTYFVALVVDGGVVVKRAVNLAVR